MNQLLLLGATLLHTRYGHWKQANGQYMINPIQDEYRAYPGLKDELVAIRERALKYEHTILDQQRIQWMAQGKFGMLDIYQSNVSIRAVDREDIIDDVDSWLEIQGEISLLNLFFTHVHTTTTD